jgi:hypothetical protein
VISAAAAHLHPFGKKALIEGRILGVPGHEQNLQVRAGLARHVGDLTPVHADAVLKLRKSAPRV